MSRLRIKALTFDLFCTTIDIVGSLTPVIEQFLRDHGSSLDAKQVWSQFRHRQRIEQYQDNLLMLGHSGYLEAARRAFLYVLRMNKIPFDRADVDGFIESWKGLNPFEDAVEGLTRLKEYYRLVVSPTGKTGSSDIS